MKYPLTTLQSRAIVAQAHPARIAQAAPDRPPAWLLQLFRQAQFTYLYLNGARVAQFDKMERWRERGQWSGHWAAFYSQRVFTAFGSYVERYAWVYHNGQFIEVRQFNVRDLPRRLLVG